MHAFVRTSTVVCALATFASCTSTTTNVTGPSDSKCQVSVTNAPASFDSNGGTGAVNVSAPRDCTWTVAAEASWIALNANPSGQGDGAVPYAVAPNPVPQPRSGALRVEDQRLPLTQAAAPCRFELSRTLESVAAGGGTARVDVSTLAGCAWSAASNVSWISIASGQSGSASGTVTMAVAANGGPAREGRVTVAGQLYTVQQAGASAPAPGPTPPTPAPPPPTPPPPDPEPPPSGETEQFEGRVFLVSGNCPDVRFFVNFTAVSATEDTEYNRGRCADLSTGDRVKVRGTRLGNGNVLATRIDFRDDD